MRALLTLVLMLSAGGCEVAPSPPPQAPPPAKDQAETPAHAPGAALAKLMEHGRYTQFVDVEHRKDQVDLASGHFKLVDTRSSSIIEAVYYDEECAYMLVGLTDRFYQYCGVPRRTRDAFESAPSAGQFYNASVRGQFDCRGSHRVHVDEVRP